MKFKFPRYLAFSLVGPRLVDAELAVEEVLQQMEHDCAVGSWNEAPLVEREVVAPSIVVEEIAHFTSVV